MKKAFQVSAAVLFLVWILLLTEVGDIDNGEPAVRADPVGTVQLSRKKQCLFQLWGKVPHQGGNTTDPAALAACSHYMETPATYEETVVLSRLAP